ncbi:MAG: methylmalonyl-CoA mutase family protein [Hyphomicrobiaceae bacterium]
MNDTHLASGFPAPTEQEWMQLVEKALKGGDFEKRLVSRTADGLRIKPLYTRASEIRGRDTAEPGAAPHLRGFRTASGTPWDIRQICATADPVVANEAILDELQGGATSILLRIAAPGQTGVGYEQGVMSRALKDVMLDVCPISLDAGELTPDAAGTLTAIWRTNGVDDGKRKGAFNYDPLGNLAATGALYHPVDTALKIAADLVAATVPMPGVTALRANGHLWHNAGATEAQELALMLASAVTCLRAAETQGIAPDIALAKIAFTVAADADQFLTIAKLRALRRLVSQVAQACGAGDAVAQVSVTAETSARMMTRRDPWVNMLRTTIAAAAAAIGGADAITVLPFSWAIGQPDAFARRIARNANHVLIEEAGLGRVSDPAGGSWYVERVTEDLAQEAWRRFQAIEAAGGLARMLANGEAQKDLSGARAARDKLLATGRQPLTGTSAFPRLGDDGVTAEPWPDASEPGKPNGATAEPLAFRRDAAPFEALRDAADAFAARSGAMPKVFLASLGPLAVHTTRTTWMRNFLAVGGVEGVGGEGWTNTADLGAAFAQTGATVACLCSSDETYGELGEAAASVLKAAGAKTVYLAGRPADQEAGLKAAGVDDFIFAGADMIATLQRVHQQLGAA